MVTRFDNDEYRGQLKPWNARLAAPDNGHWAVVQLGAEPPQCRSRDEVDRVCMPLRLREVESNLLFRSISAGEFVECYSWSEVRERVRRLVSRRPLTIRRSPTPAIIPSRMVQRSLSPTPLLMGTSASICAQTSTPDRNGWVLRSMNTGAKMRPCDGVNNGSRTVSGRSLAQIASPRAHSAAWAS
jgi:hypothetical protein